jgi:predicted DNA-binding protein (UPF0251 family)
MREINSDIGLGEEFGRRPRDQALAKRIAELKAENAELEAEERKITGEHESDLVDTMVPEKIEGANTYLQASRLSPKLEQAVRLWVVSGEEQDVVAMRCGIDKATLRSAINSPAGKSVMTEVRGALDHKFQGLFDQVITVVKDGLIHPDPSVALASANLWLRHNKATEVKVTLTAEDIVQKLLAGEDVEYA